MGTLVGGLWSGAAFGVALAASLLGSAREASACSPPPDGWFPSGVFPVPANGVVLLRYACYMGCETPPNVESLRLKSEAGELVPGSVIFSQVFDTELEIAFRPEPGALTEAGMYTAELEGVPTVAGILVGPAMTWNDALTLSEDIFEVDYPTGEPRCCEGPIDLCGNAPCFRTHVERRTAIVVGWYQEPTSEHYQYVFRMGRDSIDPAAPWVWDGGDARFELDPAEDSACYVLELKRLVDDSVQTFALRCIEQPDTFTPGLQLTREADIAAVLEACDEPPDGYEEAWCEAREPLCQTSPDEPWCADLATRCEMVGTGGAAGAPSVAGSSGTAGTAGGGGTAGSSGTAGGGGTAGTTAGAGSSGAGTGAGGGAATGGSTSIPSGAGGTAEGGAPDAEAGAAGEPNQSNSVLTKGCGCAMPSNGPRELAPWAVAVGLAAAVFARRRRRAGNRTLPIS